MKNLDALCCDGCRAKVAAIEARAHSSPEFNAEGVVQAFTDRRELLAMLENLLASVASYREKAKLIEEVLPALRALAARAPAELPPPGAE